MNICRPRPALVCAVLLGCWVWVQAPLALAQPVSLVGRWQAEPMTVRWVIGEWGDACGPRPSGGGDAGGVVNIELKNDELVISGGERSYSTARCWEMHPGLERQSHAKGSRSWATTCRTKPNDPRQEILQTTISATEDVITFRESGQYQFSLQGQTCSASSGRWRTYRRLPAGAESPTPAPVPEPEPAQVPMPVPVPSVAPSEPPADAPRRPAASPCANPGAPARIEVRPARKLMRAGESFSFRASVFDAHGCSLRTPVSWELEPPDSSAKLDGGTLQIASGAPDAELNVVATAARQSVKVTVGVVSNERYTSLLASGNFTADGASIEAATATITSGSFGAGDAAPEPGAPGRKWTFVALVGGIALCFGALGVVLLRRAQRQRRVQTRVDPGTVVFAGEPPRAAAAQAPDGAATRFDPVPSAPVSRAGTVCPICGAMYPGRDLENCPKDGAKLLPINA
ncbi:MAG TPA: hypothetical protein VFS67_13230 [Polyangiaceae bacterium]|jgi:hypothetical protein|nr:hypothetical protein [Polyangiaceae bacterium]